MTFSLSGSGTHALAANTTALHVTITTLPAVPSVGTANPPNYYQVALLRFGDGTGYFDAIPVVGGPQWLAVPNGATTLGYFCEAGAALSVTEVIGGTPPFGGGGATSLAGLSDVALASPADTQLLTYQSSSSKWINANAPSGGGGGRTLRAEQVLASTGTFAVVTGLALADHQDLVVEVYGAYAAGVTAWHNVLLQLGDAAGLKTTNYRTARWDRTGTTNDAAYSQSNGVLGVFLNGNGGSGNDLSVGVSAVTAVIPNAGGTLPNKYWHAQGGADYGSTTAGFTVGVAYAVVPCGPITQINVLADNATGFVAGSRLRVYA